MRSLRKPRTACPVSRLSSTVPASPRLVTPQERNERSAKKKKAAGEKELRHKVRPGIQEALNRVNERAQMSVTSELLQVAIMKMDLMTDEEL